MMIHRFVDHGEAVAFAQIAVEIDVAAKYVEPSGSPRRLEYRPHRVAPNKRVTDLCGLHYDHGFQRQILFGRREGDRLFARLPEPCPCRR
jgi:hypothetical protein